MKKNIFYLFLIIFNLRAQVLNVQAKLSLTQQKTFFDQNCNVFDLIKSDPILENGSYVSPYKTRFADIKSIPVADLAVRNRDYVRAIASYRPEDGTPINLLPGPEIQAKPVEQLVNYYAANYLYNIPVGYQSDSSPSVGKVISTNQDPQVFNHDYQKSLNDYYGNATVNNRGSLTVGN